MTALGPEHVGARVSVRLRVGATYLDVVGELLRYDEGSIIVRRRGGRELEALHSQIVAGRVVPPRSDAAGQVPDSALEEIAARGWRGRETARLGDWLLRAAGGWTGRANSVLPLGDPGRPIDQAINDVRSWYAERELPARFQVPLPLCVDLDAALDERSWSAYNPTLLLAADLAPVLRALPAGDIDVDLALQPSTSWLSAYHYRGAALPSDARETLLDAEQPVFASVQDGGEVVAIARAVVDERWCGVTALEVAESHRRRGLAQVVLHALFAWGRSLNARHVYMQADRLWGRPSGERLQRVIAGCLVVQSRSEVALR